MGPMIRGDHLFDGDAEFHGMILGDVTVGPDVRLRLHGMVKGDVLVQSGAFVELRGMVKGDVTLEQGAHVLLSGMVGQVFNHGGTVDYPQRQSPA
jgi:cytoskeletal protein CcmA (bactofilin family)